MLHNYKNYNFSLVLCQEILKVWRNEDMVLEVLTIFENLIENS